MKKAFLLLPLVALFVACQPDPDFGWSKDDLVAKIDARFTLRSTRTALDGSDASGYDVLWEKNDAIELLVASSKNKVGVEVYGLAGLPGSTDAKLKRTSGEKNGEPFLALHPSTLSTAPKSQNAVDVVWPQTLEYQKDALCTIPMYAAANDSILHFNALGGLLRLKIKGAGALESIVLSSNGKPLSGAGVLSQDGDSPVWSVSLSNGSDKKITMDCTTGAMLTADGTEFFFPLAENDYGTLSVKITYFDATNNTAETSGNISNIIIEKGKITPATLTVEPFAKTSVVTKTEMMGDVINRLSSGLGIPAEFINMMFGTILSNAIPDKSVTVSKIAYYTDGPAGKPIVASGLVAWTDDVDATHPFSRIVSIQHGTCDIADAPSKEFFPVELAPVYENEDGVCLNVVAMADYLGYGASETPDHQHPYMHAQQTADACADMLEAAENYVIAYGLSYADNLKSTMPIALCGYSQGGQATMATLFELQKRGYTPRITDVKAGAGPLSLPVFLEKFKGLYGKTYDRCGYLPYLVRGLLYGENSNIPLERLLAKEMYQKDAQGNCPADLFTNDRLSTWHVPLGTDVAKVLNPGFFEDEIVNPDIKAFLEIATKNSIINFGRPEKPEVVTLFHEIEDEQVPFECSLEASKLWGCRLDTIRIVNDNHLIGAVEFYMKYINEDTWKDAYAALQPILSFL